MYMLYSALSNLHSKLFARTEEGASMVEYGLLIGLIACACLAAVTLVGTDLAAFFNFVAGKVQAVTP
jgi:pilus assembly protein Flp/PilA